MHKLSERFIGDLTGVMLHSLTEAVRQDKDLNLEIRENYLNIYYKGHSLLRLQETPKGPYKTKIHNKFLAGVQDPGFLDEATLSVFVDAIPRIKTNILKHGTSLEIEYEQLIIRANNLEARNNSDYFIVDRQYSVPEGRFDLTGMFWKAKGHKKYQVVQPCLMEVKFALNDDIKDVHQQLEKYYEAIKPKSGEIARELEGIFRQKLALGLYNQPKERLEAMKTLTFAREIEQFQFILILVDYNPNSLKFGAEKIKNLPFADQVKIFNTGFAMWEEKLG